MNGNSWDLERVIFRSAAMIAAAICHSAEMRDGVPFDADVVNSYARSLVGKV